MNQFLLVEGNDDMHVCYALFAKHSVEQNFEISNCENLSNLIKGIPVRLKANPTALGIIIDSNSDIQKRWNEVRDILLKEGYSNIQDKPEQSGTIINKLLRPTIGVWLMPNNQDNGMLEDFVIASIPEDDQLFLIAQQTTSSIEQNNLNQYKPIHKSKALVHTWLAWQEDPGTPLGLAITKKYFETDNELVTQFLSWINKLFS